MARTGARRSGGLMIRRRSPWRWLRRIVATVVVVVVLVATAGFVVARRSLPAYEGTQTVAGLAAEVTVFRDTNAVPHIYAASLADAYRALGFVHAQDRFFQMEMMRRAGAGRLSEVFGSATISTDRFLRALGIYALAEQSLPDLDAETRAALDAYAAGVNAWLASDAPLPPEFLAMRTSPEPWRPADSLVWGKLMALQLADNMRDELLRARLLGRLDAAAVADLWVANPPDAPATLPDLARLYDTLDLPAIATALPDIFAKASASNAWVISGDHTTTGAPLLANDPHLGFDAPVMWYLARMVTPELSVTGATVPGVPATILGHNGNIAWGFTTTGADTQDLFVERLDPDDPDRYLTPDGSEPFITREERIAVRGRDEPEVLTVRSTRHGLVMSGLGERFDGIAATLPDADPDAQHVVALASTTLLPDDRTADGLFRLNRAGNWIQFRNAMSLFGAPVQNVLYADTTGAIGLTTPGRIPIRSAGDGSVPVPGWDGVHDWRGFVPFSAMPVARNPRGGRIVNANNRLVGEAFPHLLARDWPAAFRAERINHRLDQVTSHDTFTFTDIQRDAITLAFARLWPHLERTQTLYDAPLDRAAFGLVADWDGTMARDRPEPLIFSAWMRALAPRLYGDELGPLLARYGSSRPRVIDRMLSEQTQWCDDQDQPGTQTCDEQVAAAFRDAVAALTADLGSEPADWRWGDQHQARFSHPVFGRIPGLDRLADVTVPTDGGDFTVNRGTARPGRRPFDHVHGPGLRAVYDLADLDNSRFMTGTGQSGHVLSPHYRDFAEPWANGNSITLRGSPTALLSRGARVLTLSPE